MILVLKSQRKNNAITVSRNHTSKAPLEITLKN